MQWYEVGTKTFSVSVSGGQPPVPPTPPTTNTTMMLLGAGVLLAMALSKK